MSNDEERRKTLVDRLRGIIRIPITDGLGATGGGEEPDNPNQFVRHFQTAPIQHEAAAEIERLRDLLKGFPKNDRSVPCPTCGFVIFKKDHQPFTFDDD